MIGQTPKTQIVDQFARHVSSGKVEFFQQFGVDLIFGKREGVYVWDTDGRRLIDCHCNGGVFNLGHRNPRVIGAVKRALDELDIGNHQFSNLDQRLKQPAGFLGWHTNDQNSLRAENSRLSSGIAILHLVYLQL